MRELTSTQVEFLRILETFMNDEKYCFPQDFTGLLELYQMAGIHHMISAVFEQIYQEELFGQEENGNIARLFKMQTVQSVMMQTQKTEGFKRIYGKLREAGVKPLVVKGIICRNLYTKPDHRPSSDEDMLIKREEFEICDQVLVAEGFRREELVMDQLPYEIPYRHPQNGVYIELHLSLFPEESGAYGHLNREFEKVFERSICERIEGMDIWTLGPTDHMFYLICHSFKHFLHSGFGMRQVCDMVKMEEHYRKVIDWKEIRAKLERLYMDTYWDALVEIGIAYLGAAWEKVHEVDCQELLLDLMDSGIYGDSSMERKHSSNMTLAAVKSGKKNMTASLTASLFPGLTYMKSGYPWLKKYPWLLPAAWGFRIVGYLQNSGKRNEEESSVEIGVNRVELLRKYNIIE